MANNAVGWFEIYVDEMPRAKAFYEAVFEMTLQPLPSPGTGPGMEMWTFAGQPTQYGAPGALVKMPGFSAGRNSVIIYFSCADCAVQAARAAQHGGRVQQPKTAIGAYGHIALVVDSEGNMIGLHSMQ